MLPVTSIKEPEEREFVVDSGASVHMVSKKDLNSAQLETLTISRSPTTVMTANGEVQTREEATVCVKQLDLFVKIMLLEKNSLSSFSWGNSVRIMGIHTSGSAVRNHISSEMARELIAIYRAMYHLWFLVFQRVLSRLHLHLLLRHRMNCLIGDKNSERIWLMNVLQMSLKGNPEQGSQDTSESSREHPTEPRAKVEPSSSNHCVFLHFPKYPNFDVCLKTKITMASCSRRAGTVVPRAENVGDFFAADHKVLSEESDSRDNHRYAVVVQDFATQWIQSYPRKTDEVPGADEETKSHLPLTIPLNLASLAKNYPGIIVRQRHTDQKQMGLLREQCAE